MNVNDLNQQKIPEDFVLYIKMKFLHLLNNIFP